jgi:hypothetical protein
MRGRLSMWSPRLSRLDGTLSGRRDSGARHGRAVQQLAFGGGAGHEIRMPHEFFWKEPALLQALVEAGAWVQVTVDSLLGNHGPAPKVSGEALLRAYPECSPGDRRS